MKTTRTFKSKPQAPPPPPPPPPQQGWSQPVEESAETHQCKELLSFRAGFDSPVVRLVEREPLDVS